MTENLHQQSSLIIIIIIIVNWICIQLYLSFSSLNISYTYSICQGSLAAVLSVTLGVDSIAS